MDEKKPVSMEQLFEKKASQQMVSEGNQFQTVPRGVYGIRATKYDAFENPKQEVNGSPRTIINFWVDITGEDGTRKSKAFLRISPDEYRGPKGYLDTASKLYAQLSKALFANASEQPTTGELVQTFLQTPVKGFVSLQFKGPKDPVTGKNIYVDPKTEDEEKDCRMRGYEPSNVIRSVQRA